MQNNKKLIVYFVIAILIPLAGFSQTSHQPFIEKSLQTQNTGMYILGTWALLNITTGAYGWKNYSGSQMYFNQMNLFWNTINLSIAGIALYNNYHTNFLLLSQAEALANHTRVEKLFLINTGLDVVYIGAGFLLKHFSVKYPDKSNIFTGYGNSVILQGGFLLLFDAVWYGIMRSQRLNFLTLGDVSIIPSPTGLQFTLLF